MTDLALEFWKLLLDLNIYTHATQSICNHVAPPQQPLPPPPKKPTSELLLKMYYAQLSEQDTPGK